MDYQQQEQQELPIEIMLMIFEYSKYNTHVETTSESVNKTIFTWPCVSTIYRHIFTDNKNAITDFIKDKIDGLSSELFSFALAATENGVSVNLFHVGTNLEDDTKYEVPKATFTMSLVDVTFRVKRIYVGIGDDDRNEEYSFYNKEKAMWTFFNNIHQNKYYFKFSYDITPNLYPGDIEDFVIRILKANETYQVCGLVRNMNWLKLYNLVYKMKLSGSWFRLSEFIKITKNIVKPKKQIMCAEQQDPVPDSDEVPIYQPAKKPKISISDD